MFWKLEPVANISIGASFELRPIECHIFSDMEDIYEFQDDHGETSQKAMNNGKVYNYYNII